jgi:hypothetical protein
LGSESSLRRSLSSKTSQVSTRLNCRRATRP